MRFTVEPVFIGPYQESIDGFYVRLKFTYGNFSPNTSSNWSDLINITFTKGEARSYTIVLYGTGQLASFTGPKLPFSYTNPVSFESNFFYTFRSPNGSALQVFTPQEGLGLQSDISLSYKVIITRTIGGNTPGGSWSSPLVSLNLGKAPKRITTITTTTAPIFTTTTTTTTPLPSDNRIVEQRIINNIANSSIINQTRLVLPRGTGSGPAYSVPNGTYLSFSVVADGGYTFDRLNCVGYESVPIYERFKYNAKLKDVIQQDEKFVITRGSVQGLKIEYSIGGPSFNKLDVKIYFTSTSWFKGSGFLEIELAGLTCSLITTTTSTTRTTTTTTTSTTTAPNINLPTPPTLLSAKNAFDSSIPNTGEILLEWSDNNTQKINRYAIRRRVSGSSTSFQTVAYTTLKSFTLKALINYQNYDFQILAENQDFLLSNPSNTLAAMPYDRLSTTITVGSIGNGDANIRTSIDPINWTAEKGRPAKGFTVGSLNNVLGRLTLSTTNSTVINSNTIGQPVIVNYSTTTRDTERRKVFNNPSRNPSSVINFSGPEYKYDSNGSIYQVSWLILGEIPPSYIIQQPGTGRLYDDFFSFTYDIGVRGVAQSTSTTSSTTSNPNVSTTTTTSNPNVSTTTTTRRPTTTTSSTTTRRPTTTTNTPALTTTAATRAMQLPKWRTTTTTPTPKTIISQTNAVTTTATTTTRTPRQPQRNYNITTPAPKFPPGASSPVVSPQVIALYEDINFKQQNKDATNDNGNSIITKIRTRE